MRIADRTIEPRDRESIVRVVSSAAMTMARTIEVNLSAEASRSYSSTIERDSLRRLGETVRSLGATGRIVLVVDANIAETHGVTAAASLHHAGFDVIRHALTADEKHKSLGSVREIYDAMLAARIDRSSFVIALGGGIVGDVAGFAAATYMRGIPVVQVPTTLLAMVDAAIGGKTGVNAVLPDGSIGKNLIGAFWQPRAVIVDPNVLMTLDDRHFRCGLAECVKHGMIEETSNRPDVETSKRKRDQGIEASRHQGGTPSQSLMEFLSQQAPTIVAKDMEAVTELIARSAAIKAAFVMADERESGQRALLNLGHTFGHALESVTELNLMHGEAVVIGLVAAIRCSVETKRMTEPEADRVRSLLNAFGLPTRMPMPIPAARLRSAMQFDKKSQGGRMRLVLPLGSGGAVVTDDVPTTVVDRALAEIGAT